MSLSHVSLADVRFTYALAAVIVLLAVRELADFARGGQAPDGEVTTGGGEPESRSLSGLLRVSSMTLAVALAIALLFVNVSRWFFVGAAVVAGCLAIAPERIRVWLDARHSNRSPREQ